VSAAAGVDLPASTAAVLPRSVSHEGLAALRPGDAGSPEDGSARRPRRGAAGGKAARERRYLRYRDGELMSLMEGGDAEACAALYDRHSRAAYSLAYRMMGERQAAEDLAQDAFLKVWRSAGGFRSERGSVRTWVLSIVHNRGIDQLRSMASRRRTQDRVEQSAPRSQPSEAFAEAWRNRQREQIREALGSLPAEQLKILELAYFSGYTQAEIALMLGIPLGTVKGRVRLGLKKVGDSLRSPGAENRRDRGIPGGGRRARAESKR
jgi:RNA polymerase sigma-70 factor, ECF subfamily